MSKKSRKRNKKILAMLALAGGAAMMGRGKGTAFPRPKAGTIDQMAADAAGPVTGVTNPNEAIAKAKADAALSGKSYLSKMQGGDPDDPTGHIAQKRRGLNAQIMQAKANAPKGVIRPGNYTPITHGAAFGHRGVGFKKGGSVKKAKVTGIAKRGFGRALMKGKK